MEHKHEEKKRSEAAKTSAANNKANFRRNHGVWYGRYPHHIPVAKKIKIERIFARS